MKNTLSTADEKKVLSLLQNNFDQTYILEKFRSKELSEEVIKEAIAKTEISLYELDKKLARRKARGIIFIGVIVFGLGLALLLSNGMLLGWTKMFFGGFRIIRGYIYFRDAN